MGVVDVITWAIQSTDEERLEIARITGPVDSLQITQKARFVDILGWVALKQGRYQNISKVL